MVTQNLLMGHKPVLGHYLNVTDNCKQN